MHYRSHLSPAALLLLCTLMLTSAAGFDRMVADNPAAMPFATGEELIYEGEFSRSLLRGINVAEFRFAVKRAPAETADADATAPRLNFTLEAVSKGFFTKLFGLDFRQRVEATVEPASFTLLRSQRLDVQGRRRRASETVFDSGAGKLVWTERDLNDPARAPRVVTSEVGGDVQDLASIFYLLRTQSLEPGKSFEIPLSDSGYLYRVPFRVREKKVMKTVLGRVTVVRVEPDVFGADRLVDGKGKMSIWFTDDARRIPVRLQISHEIGSLDIKLKQIVTAAAPAKTRQLESPDSTFRQSK